MASTLLARGRDADVYAEGSERVRRRYRDPAHSAEPEALLMRYLHVQGYPVPAVFDASGPDLLMARVTGPTMLTALGRRPWTARLHARVLAGLHQGLHVIPPPPQLRGPWEDRASIVHLDLHPDNVILAPGGPVVIDWANAAAGPAGLDLARTWVIVGAMGGVPAAWQRPVAARVRRSFVREFLAYADQPAARQWFDHAVELTLLDHNVTTTEAVAIRELQRRS
ncbi:MAG: hypothetical protein NVSMB12_14200 [Acidimicrobiales bacterium]